jgi:ParB family transcriptional regulator, chromosome partitioning protein
MPTLTSKPLSWFKVAPQVRQEFDEGDLRRLGESMKAHGQLQPVLARPDGTLIAGERRLRAATLVGLPTLNVIITEDLLSETQIKVIQLTENLHRSDLRDSEKWKAFEELARLNPDWSNKDLAAHLKLSESTVTKYQAPSRCIPEVQNALRAGKLGITAVYEISRVPADQQPALLALKLSGASRDAIVHAGRKSRNGNTPAVKLSRVKIAMPHATVVLSGKELCMADVVDLLAETLKEARKAADQFDVKTWLSMMKDKAKAAR